MKKILVIVTLLGLASAASLPFAVIPEGGLVIGKYTTNQSGVEEKWSTGGFEVGAKISYNFPDTKFYIEPGIYYTYVEGKINENSTEKKYDLHFLKFPVSFVYKVYTNNDISVKAGGGPYLAYRLDGDDTEYEDWDFGLSLEASLTYMGKFVLDSRFDLGLRDLDKSNDEVKTRAFVIDVGYKLNF